MTQTPAKVFVDACYGRETPHTPIWLNRQAGRYMPEYHAVKGKTPSLEFFKHPELAARAALDAQRILGTDAAILFADLLPVLEPMGLHLDYVPGQGPQFDNPVRSERDIDALIEFDPREETAYVEGTIANIQQELPPEIALIGFTGAPFTLASYAIEGRGSRNYVWVKKLMYAEPGLWDRLMGKLVNVVAGYARQQIDAGVDAIQLFDTWVGCLSVGDFRRYVLPHLTRLIDAVRGSVPVIYFGTGNSHLLEATMESRPDVLAVDWRTPLAATWDELSLTAVQGNLDPIVLCADRAAVETQARAVLDEAAGRAGHIFNLGHGIIPETPVDNVKFLVDLVHERTASSG